MIQRPIIPGILVSTSFFEAQVERTPRGHCGAVRREAVDPPGAKIVEQISWRITYKDSESAPEKLVGDLCGAVFLEMVIGLLGILKAGGAYVPSGSGSISERALNVHVEKRPGFGSPHPRKV